VSAVTRDRTGLAIAVVCVAGLAIAGYLTYVHYAGLKVSACT
jgi:hypothetical protein